MNSAIREAQVAIPPTLAYAPRKSRWRRPILLLTTLVVGMPAMIVGRRWCVDRFDTWRALSARRNEIRYQVSTNLAAADAAIQTYRWADAQLGVDRARLAAYADPTDFDAAEMGKLTADVDAAELRVQKAMRAIGYSARIRSNAIGCVFSVSLADRVEMMNSLAHSGRFQEALLIAEQLLILDLERPEAAAVKEICNNGLGLQLDESTSD